MSEKVVHVNGVCLTVRPVPPSPEFERAFWERFGDLYQAEDKANLTAAEIGRRNETPPDDVSGIDRELTHGELSAEG